MSKESTTQGNNRIFVVGVDMENRSPEDKLILRIRRMMEECTETDVICVMTP